MTQRSFWLATAAALVASSVAAETPTPPGTLYSSPIPAAQRRAFFGELHLHTTMSFDAWAFGTSITPDQAYKFARGETVMVPVEQLAMEEGIHSERPVPARRAWPLDFMAVTDHSEYMGVLNQFDDANNPMSKTDLGQKLAKDRRLSMSMWAPGAKPLDPATTNTLQAMRTAWDVEVKAANANYIPGKFTTFIAYEWSAMPQGKYNLHRNVFFNSDHAPLPFSSLDSIKPENLWNYLEKTRASGIDVIAIPHNGNASNGLMYDWNDFDGRPIDEKYAQRRALNEPLTEITQTKGQSDTTPELSPEDEFANFEIFDQLLTSPGVEGKQNGSYIRQAFGRGLLIQSKVGVNPYKYGVVGATDIHNGLTTTSENAIAGGAWGIDPSTMLPSGDAARRALNLPPSGAIGVSLSAAATPTKGPNPKSEYTTDIGSGGLTGVWAEENTRNSIFAALIRKETFATTGTRIRVRMFAGWTYPRDLTRHADWVATAYAQGVPMGGDLPRRSSSAGAPHFILQAEKDPDGANLDRIQVIKIWLDGGDYKEKIFNVALSGGRKDHAGGHATPVGNTVDLKTATYSNSIGAGILTTEWVDPAFAAHKAAVYYARVLEIPTPRWTTILAAKNHLPIPKDVPATIQERAWSSPIWFTPG